MWASAQPLMEPVEFDVLQAIAEGTLNAVVFWFDLHLDSTETISNAPPGFLPGGLSGADTLLSDAARQLSTLHNQTSDNGHGPTTTTAHQQHKDCPIAEDAEAAQGLMAATYCLAMQ